MVKQKKKQIFIISGVIFVLVALLGFATWFMTRPGAGIENVTKNELNVEWYDENEKEFTITTAEELFEFAQLSSYYDFRGQTIKLGADIVVNEGNADDWGIEFPELIWDQPIDSFAGTFDGQGHTISGIYCMGYLYKCSPKGLKPLPAGLFTNTQECCVIKNFKLVNSYFCGDMQDGAATISAIGGGTFDSIYSNARLISYKNCNGGILGQASESATITNCWYDGKMEILGGYPRYSAGIIGRAMNKEADFLIEHCLVTATMYNETTNAGVGMGAILGNVKDSSSVTINDCFVASHLTNEYGVAVGSVYGVSEKNAVVNMTHTYSTEESYNKLVGAVLGTANGMPVGFPTETLKGCGAYQWTTLDFDKYWSAVEGSTPILTTFADNALALDGVQKYIDISWYDENASEFILYDAADLYGFSILSQSYNFENKTVKLGADITVNTGKASDWGKTAPQFAWKSIGSNSLPFAGTFDGQMHTISGIYHTANTPYSGLFSTTATTATIKRLKLTNSYMTTTDLSFGSIAGRGRGTFDTIYSDAIVVSDGGNVGGIIGQIPADGNVTMKNCWFAGKVTSLGNIKLKRNTGGLVGVSYSDSTITNCLNTGTIDATTYSCTNSETSKAIAPMVGGIIGYVSNKSTLKISHCLNVGPVKYNKVSTGGYGSIVGWSDSKVQLANTYSLQDSCPLTAKGKVEGWVIALEKDQLIGLEGHRWTTLDFNKYWAANSGTPTLRSFSGKGMSVSGVDKMVDVSWYQEKKDTYILNDAANLYGLAYISQGLDFAGKTVKLGADITINTGNAAEWASAAPINEWYCISSKSLPFAGTFDGQMHTVSGLYVNGEINNVGLFAATGTTSTIKNLKLTNSYVTSTGSDVGSVAGQGRGTFDTIYSDAVISACRERVGGIIGMGYGKEVVMKNCWFAGNIKNTANEKNYRGTGGIIGTIWEDGKATIEGCLNTGTIDVTAYTYNQSKNGKVVAPIAGGIVGWVYSTKTTVDISDCLNTGKIFTSEDANNGVGAIVGFTDYIKGTAVSATYATTTPLSGSKVTGKIFAVSEDEISGYKGYQWTFLDFDKYWAAVADSTPVLKSFANNVLSLASVSRMIDISWVDKADGSAKDPYKISKKEELYGLAMLSMEAEYDAFKGKTIVLTDDIELNTGEDISAWDEWTPIGSKEVPFAGTFDGQMHTISGLYLNAQNNNVGLFAATGTTSTIKNLKLANSHITSTGSDVGSIAGQGRGTFDTLYSDAVINACRERVGGIIGMGYGTDVVMKNCWFAGSITNTANTKNYRGTGGIIGTLWEKGDAKIEGCLNTGTIDVTAYTFNQSTTGTVVAPIAGGIIGWVYATKTTTTTIDISNCLDAGTILASNAANNGIGAILGTRENTAEATVSKTYAITTPVSGSKVTGKIFEVSEDEIRGYKGYQWTLLDFDKYWTVVLDDAKTTNKDESGTPILKSFASVVPSLEKVDKMLNISWIDETDGNSKDTAYCISSKADLYGLAMLAAETEYNGFAGKYFKLTANITINEGNASEWGENAPENSWTPIGNSDIPFAGYFDGDNHTISGIYINSTSENLGLFGYLKPAANKEKPYVKNLKIVNSYITGSGRKIASIAGTVEGGASFDSVYSEAIVESSNRWLAGFVGLALTANIDMNNCWFAGEVKSTVTTSKLQGTGGFIGDLNAKSTLTVTNCLNTGLIDVSSYVSGTTVCPCAAGYVGYVEGNSTNYATVRISKSINAGTVLVNEKATVGYGPFIGYRGAGDIKISNSVFVMAETYNLKTHSNTAVSNLTNVTQVTKAADLVSMTPNTLANDYGFDFNETWVAVDYTIPILKSFKNLVIDTSWYEGHENDATYTLKDRADLYGLAVLSQTRRFEGKTITLDADIVVNVGDADSWAKGAPSFRWLPIGSTSSPFAGTFNGDMHTISGIYCNTTAENTGLFGCLQNKDSVYPTIQNLKLENSYIKSTARKAGSIAGSVLGKANIDSVYSNANVESSNQWLGGFVGLVFNAEVTMNNCWFAGEVTSTVTTSALQCTGGFIGNVHSKSTLTMTNCLNTGTVDVSSFALKNSDGKYRPFAGGFIGRMEGNSTTYATVVIRNSINKGAVLINQNVTPVVAYGPFVGERVGMLNIYNSVYVMAGEYDAKAISNITESSSYHNVTKLPSETDLVGKDVVGTFGFEANAYWETNSNDMPTLKDFTK